jgi:1,4-dihydroxy-2-naphthoate octaprenyltransferase
MATVRAWFLETRPSFLLLVPVCVLIGVATAVYDTRELNVLHFGLAFLGALLAHISVNVLNDYSDYQTGIDLNTRKTPFSGGSGILPAGLLSSRKVFIFGMACLLAVAAIGAYFIYEYTWRILPIGVLGILVVYFYTTHLTKDPLLCAIAPGLGFGPLMVLGIYFTQTGEYTLSAGLASMIPGFLVSNLLLLNQFPDLEADRAGARRHLLITIGRERSAKVYAGLILATYVWLVFSVAFKELPWGALLGLLTLPLGIQAVRGVLRYSEDIDNLIPFMGRNVMVTLLTPLLAGVGVLISTALS